MEELAAAGFDLHRSLSVDLSKRLQDVQSTHGDTPAPLEYRRISHLHLVTHEYQREHLEHEMAVFKEHCEADGGGYDARIEDILLLPGTLRRRAAWFNLTRVSGAYGVHSPDEAAQVEPDKLRASLLHAAVSMGAQLLQGHVENVTLSPAHGASSRRLTGVLVRLGPDHNKGELVEIRAGRVVFAMGAASLLLNHWFFFVLPVFKLSFVRVHLHMHDAN